MQLKELTWFCCFKVYISYRDTLLDAVSHVAKKRLRRLVVVDDTGSGMSLKLSCWKELIGALA